MVEIKWEDIVYGIELLKKEKCKAFVKMFNEFSHEFYINICFLAMKSAEVKYKRETSLFTDEVAKFITTTFFLIGVLYSAYGKSIPPIDQKLFEEVGGGLLGSDNSYGEPLNVRIEHKLGNANPILIKVFKELLKEFDMSWLPETYILFIAGVFLRAAEREAKSISHETISKDKEESFFIGDLEKNSGELKS